MKKIISIGVALVLLVAGLVTAVPASAANGVDVVHTFENYFNAKKDFISNEWTTYGCLTSSTIHTDTTTSAPNRGDGKSQGNYRSMRVDFDFSKDSWGSWRNRTEDNYALIDPINNNEDVYFTFYAKATGNITILAEVDMKDVPFYKYIKLTTEWKYYRLSLRELLPELADTAGNWTNIYERNVAKHWGSGKEEPFLVGFKFQVNADYTGATAGSVWLDTLAFEGATISERTSFSTEGGTTFDTINDRSGKVPADFNASTASSKTSSVISNKTSTSSGTAANSNKTSAASKGSTTSNVTSGDSATSSDLVTSDVSSDVSDADSSDANRQTTSNKTTSSVDVDKENDGWPTGAKILLIAGIIVLLAGGGAAVYFFVFKKKQER